MRKSLAVRLSAILFAVGSSSLGVGCTECSCRSDAIVVEVPAGCGVKVASVLAAGSGCHLVEVSLGKAEYDFFEVHPTQQGTCDIRVEFEDGWSYDFAATVEVNEDSCCPGPYPIPEHSSVEVPYPGACGL